MFYGEMVAWFNKSSILTSVRFKTYNDDTTSTIKINKILFAEIEKLARNKIIVYRCQSAFNRIEKLYMIKYELCACKWMCFKYKASKYIYIV